MFSSVPIDSVVYLRFRNPPWFRIADVAIAAIAIVLLLPMLLGTALLIALYDNGPILFAQERVGAGGRTFRCFKFRTMQVDAERKLRDLLESSAKARLEWAADQKLRDDPRITPIGSFLRKSSIDELPQLLNVLRGEMSIVGPRPIVRAEVRRYGPRIKAYYSVRPGITGLWQVSGRNEVSYRRRVAYDVIFVRNRSGWLYLAVILLTVPTVLFRRGAY